MINCAWCGRPKGAYGPTDYCTFTCKVKAKEEAARAVRAERVATTAGASPSNLADRKDED